MLQSAMAEIVPCQLMD